MIVDEGKINQSFATNKVEVEMNIDGLKFLKAVVIGMTLTFLIIIIIILFN